MIWLQKRFNKEKKLFRANGIAFLLVCGAVFLFFFYRDAVEKIVTAPLAPLERIGKFSTDTFLNFIETVKSKRSLIAENNALREQYSAQSIALLDRNALAEENSELKHMLGRTLRRDTVLAAVLQKPPVSPYDTLLIDIGKDENISEGDEVIAGNSFSIGVIDAVFPHEAKVLLLSAPGKTTNVLVGGKHLLTAAVGKGGGNFEVRLPRDARVVVGDAVLLPGLSNSPLGAVAEIRVRPTDTFQTILFRLPVNLFELRHVSVVRRNS